MGSRRMPRHHGAKVADFGARVEGVAVRRRHIVTDWDDKLSKSERSWKRNRKTKWKS